ncbi:hypothetical protein NDU88_007150 [Pleurodeles waltl]|uniref:Uncharacterized protein n=1 Tax=Pleurodeles waltl TaxID=8319 RepID=A0AAV7RU62_PLEWA|nr:hypothetical protein NDU88_007150 [Pleurodeles waltl]
MVPSGRGQKTVEIGLDFDTLDTPRSGWTPWNGQQHKSRGKQCHPNKETLKVTKLQKRAKEQVDEEKEAAIRAVADLANHRGSDHELGMDPKEMATDSDMERSAPEGDDLPVVTPQTVDDLI